MPQGKLHAVRFGFGLAKEALIVAHRGFRKEECCVFRRDGEFHTFFWVTVSFKTKFIDIH